MPLPEEGPLSASQVATEFGVNQSSISFQNLGSFVGIEPGEDPVTLPDNFYGAAGSTPTVATNAASSVTTTSMTINGNVTNTGASAVTNRGFYFGTNSNYASNTKTQVGSGTGAYTLAKTSLIANTTYYITAYAINTQGEARGSTISQATSGASTTEGSLMRYGQNTYLNLDNRLLQPSTQEPTTSLRMGATSTFTLNFWIKAGWTSAYNNNQFLWGTAANPKVLSYTTNVYNHNFRMWYAETNNRINFSWLGMNQANSATGYTQNFWFLHKSGAGQAGDVTGLGTSYPGDNWTNTNRGYTNTNGFTMITITYNGSMSSSNLKCYWNGNNIGAAYYGSGQNGGATTYNNTSLPRLTSLLGSPYGPNGTLTGTGDQTCGYGGGNGNTYIDQYSLWNSALSSTDVTALWNSGDGGSISTSTQPSGLITYYSMDSNTQATPGGSSPDYVTPVWPSGGTTGKMYLSGSSDFGSGTNTVDG